jgi:type II secretory pathway pseudopilin PulG
MKKKYGFTLVELVIFTMVLGILAGGILSAFYTTLGTLPRNSKNAIAANAAAKCMEWFVGQRYLNGIASINCGNAIPSFCAVSTGYAIAAQVNCSAVGKGITVSVSGLGNASFSLFLTN